MAELLTVLCYQRISQLLQDLYWRSDKPSNFNPFTLLPYEIVDKILTYVTQVKEDEMLERSHLQLLLTSGRVRNFILCDISQNVTQPWQMKIRKPIVTSRILYNILLDLFPSSHSLTAIKINLSISDEYSTEIRSVLNALLYESPNLKRVESTIQFDISALCNADNLEELVIKFHVDVNNHINDFLKVNGQLKPHTSLKYLTVDDFMSKLSVDIDSVLTYCTELISFNCDIAKNLERLHAEALRSGSLTHQYKLENIVLGCSSISSHGVSKEAICIASRTCPNATKLKISADRERMLLLRNFHNLKDLTWLSKEFNMDELFSDYVTVKGLLEEPTFGYKLTCLFFDNLRNVDFASIGNSCPNLKKLTVCYGSEQNCSQFLPTSYQQLANLFLSKSILDSVNADTLVGILSNAVNLSLLWIYRASQLTDELLRDILRKNKLSNLETIYLDSCNLSASGIEHLAVSLTALKYFSVNEYLPIAYTDQIFAIFRQKNPKVIVSRV